LRGKRKSDIARPDPIRPIQNVVPGELGHRNNNFRTINY